jgi:hypothetical protein
MELFMNTSRERDNKDLRVSVIPPKSKFTSAQLPPALDPVKISRRDILEKV